MLRKKMLRDIKQNVSQFITIFLMVLIGVMAYTGISGYMDGMQQTADTFYKENNLQDLNVMGYQFSEDDLNAIKDMDNVENAERKWVFNAINSDDEDKNFLVNVIEENDISKLYVIDGEKFDKNKEGVWLDNFYAEENNLKVGDTIKFKYGNKTYVEKILGLINVPDHIYDIKDESQLLPDRTNYGFVYISSEEFDNIPYNYIMVDVDDKENVDTVKNNIEDKIKNALAIVKIEDTASYSMYQSEIDEGKAYVGVFSGLFLFIALLSVITTMSRVIKKQRLQIGTLKALGFKKKKIIWHYVGYGFWVSLAGAICGLFAGRYLLGAYFIKLEMEYFEVPNGIVVTKAENYLVAALTVIFISLITYLTCRKELKKSAADAIRNEVPKVKGKNLNFTSKGIFKKCKFSTIWNIRDIVRNKFRTATAIIGVTGCCMLIVCAFGMLNSMNYFIKLQFHDLYNFNYKLTLEENLTSEQIEKLTDKYGEFTSETLGIEIKDEDGNRDSNNIFVSDAGNYIRFQDDKNNFINLDNNDGIYVTYKLAELNGYKIGDTVTWHIYGEDKYYESEIVGFNKDPQNQNMTMTREYLESIGLDYIPDSIYTNEDLKKSKDIENVEIVQDINSLEDSISEMLSMMETMITIIIVFAVILGAVIIYNMGVLSYNEKEYQFATLKVLGFKNKHIEKIFIKQNLWITIVSIILGLPFGDLLTKWLFKECLDESYDFGAHIDPMTFVYAAVGTFVVSYVVSKFLGRKVRKIDMVASLKENE